MKYKNIKVNGFASKKEAGRYPELLLLQKAGKIHDLRCQVRFEVVPAQYEYYERYGKKGQRLKDGKRCVERAVDYVADFDYYTEDGTYVVEDTKGFKTKDYIIKRKLMLWVHGIRIREV